MERKGEERRGEEHALSEAHACGVMLCKLGEKGEVRKEKEDRDEIIHYQKNMHLIYSSDYTLL